MNYEAICEYLKNNGINDYSKFRLQNDSDGFGTYICNWDYSIPKPSESELISADLSARKKNLVIRIKQEAGKRIYDAYPQYKQNNILGAASAIYNKELIAMKTNTVYVLTTEEKSIMRKANACATYISFIRDKSNQLEALVDTYTEVNALLDLDITDDNFWV
jgi:hypothetical protein